MVQATQEEKRFGIRSVPKDVMDMLAELERWYAEDGEGKYTRSMIWVKALRRLHHEEKRKRKGAAA